MECAICLQPLTPPVKVLDCGHSFCQPCIQDLVLANGVPINDIFVPIACPTCRRQTLIHEGRINNLPTNFALNILLEKRRTAAINENRSSSEHFLSEDNQRVNPETEQVNGNLIEIENVSGESSAIFNNERINAESAEQVNQPVPEILVASERPDVVQEMSEESHLESLAPRDQLSLDNTWRCSNEFCQTFNFEFRIICRLCFTIRPESEQVHGQNIDQENHHILAFHHVRCLRSCTENRSLWSLL